MTAVQYNNCEHLHISFERKHNKESKEENICPYLGALHSQNWLQLFVLDSGFSFWIHMELIVCIFNFFKTLFILRLFSRLQ